MNITDFNFSIIEQDAAKTLLNSISPIEDNNRTKTDLHYEENSFSIGSKVDWMPYMSFRACDFFHIEWEGINGINSCLNYSIFRNCSFENCNLKYSDWGGTTFDSITGRATSFDYSDFSNAEIYGSAFIGCSFSSCFFYKTKFNNCTFCQVEFTNTIFMDVHFDALDFSKTSFKNAEFRKCIFINCTLPFFEIMHISYGLKEIFSNNDIQFKPIKTNHIVNCKEYLMEMCELLPFFFSDKDYISMTNIYILIGKMTSAYQSLEHGLIYACNKKNFELINSLCKIASINNFSSSCLKKLYNTLTTNIQIRELSNIEYYRYLEQLIKSEGLLFDSIDNLNTMYITVETSYSYKETDKLAGTIQKLYEISDIIDNNITNKIVIRHNSPPTINFILSGDFYNLVLVFAGILYVFKKTTSFIEQVQQLIKSHNDIKLQKINLKLKELELLRTETEKQNKSKILLPDDFSNISYIMKAAPDYPNILFSFNLENNKGIPHL